MTAEPLDEARLQAESKWVLDRLRARHPDLLPYVRMEPDAGRGTCHLLVTAPSPTGDGTRDAYLWMECGDEPSIGFGHWHTHFDIQGDREAAERTIDDAVDVLAAIVSDQQVLLYDSPYPGSRTCNVLPVDDDDAWADELSSEHTPVSVNVRTWSGRGDHDLMVSESAPTLAVARLKAAHGASIRHRSAVEASERCGCFYCKATFAPAAITTWTDGGDTAICPRCGIDSVLPSAAGFPITAGFLGAMNRHWF